MCLDAPLACAQEAAPGAEPAGEPTPGDLLEITPELQEAIDRGLVALA
jgi:hypothetical protein